MSNKHLLAVRKVKDCPPRERLLLLLIADRVNNEGNWQIGMKELVSQSGLDRTSVRRTLDSLAAKGLVAFKAEKYARYPGAQAAHRYMLIHNEGDKTIAERLGYSFERRQIERSRLSIDANANELNITHSGSDVGPTLGYTATPQTKLPNEPQNLPPPYPPSKKRAKCSCEAESLELWNRFKTPYPVDHLDPIRPAQKYFFSLSIEDQRLAANHIEPYVREWKARKRSKPFVGMKRWLEEERWIISDHQSSFIGGIGVRVYEGTPEHLAWCRYLKEIKMSWVASNNDDRGRAYAIKRTKFPPSSSSA